MARIAWVNLPNGKHVEIALTYIYGIGRSVSNDILVKVGIEKNRKIETLSEEELDKIKLPAGMEKFFWNEQNMYFGGVHAVFMDAQGGLDGAGDRRRVGHVIKVY